MKKMNVALVSHIIKEDNLGCGALAISNIKLLDRVFARLEIQVHYLIATTDNLEKVPLEEYTSNSYEYRLYPRCSQTLKNPMRLLNTKVFENCDLVINLCGGDGYTDIYGFPRLLAESQLAWVAKRHHIPTLYAPQTIGPFETGKGRFVAKKTLSKVDHIFVRDHKSYLCCEQLGLKDHTQEVIDVAFALPFDKQLPEQNGTRHIGLNVSGLLYNGGYDRKNYFGLSFSYKEFVHMLLEKLKTMDGITVHLIPHVNTNSHPVDDDYEVCKALSEQYGCVLAPRFESPIDAKNYISGMDLFCGGRMHSTIGAISSGVPVIPVAYSRKFNGLYEALEYKWLIDAKADLTAQQAVEQFMEYSDQIDVMQKDVDNAKRIFTAKLEQYQDYLAELIQKLL